MEQKLYHDHPLLKYKLFIKYNKGGNPRTPWASAMQTSSLPDKLGRPSLHYADKSLRYADRASAMQ